MKTLLIFATFFCASLIYAQPPYIHWQKSLGGSSYEEAASIQQTVDGGYIVAGCTTSNDGDVSGNHGGYDYWVVKLNSLGVIEWQKALGGSSHEEAASIRQTVDGGYIAAGYTKSNDGDVSGNHGGYDYWVVKLNSLGVIEWQKALGGGSDEFARSIQQTSDGGYIVAGYAESNDGDVSGNHGSFDYWVVKLNPLGVIEWQKALGGSGSDYARSIQQTSDGGYIVVGNTESNDGNVSGNHGLSDYWVVKLNSSGVIEWQKALSGSSEDAGRSIQQTSDGGYIVAGNAESNDGNVSGNHGASDYWVVKLNSSGVIEWQKSLGGTNYDEARSIQQTADGGYIVAGYIASINGDVSGNHGNDDCWVVKLNSLGVIEWQKALGGSSSDIATSIQQTADGGYIMAGYTLSNDGDVSGSHGNFDCWIVKLGYCESPVITVSESSGTPHDGTICLGENVELSASEGNTYLWSTGDTTQTIFVTPLMTTLYSVTVTIGSCVRDSSVLITVNPLPIATAGSNSPVCAGATINLTSTGGTSYSWSGPGGWTSTLQNPTRVNATAAMAGTYNVTVTSAGGCSSTASTNVIVNPLPVASAKADPNPVCSGHYARLYAAGGVSYLWSGPNGFTSTLQNPGLGLAQINMAGNYTVTVTNAEGCSSTASVNLVVNQSPNGTASVTPQFVCVGNTAQLSASGGQSYLWRGPGGFVSTQQNPVINVTSHVQGGTYWVTISNANGCYVQLSVELTVSYPPAVTATHEQSTACTGSTLKLFGSGVGTYLWTGPGGWTSTQQNPQIPNVTPANSGTYTLKVTAPGGCSATATTTVNVVAPPSLTAWADDYDICEFSTAYLHATGATGYEWSGPWGYYSTFQHPVMYYVPVYMTGTYTVKGTGPTGCSATKSFDLNVYLDINGTISATPNPVLYGGTLQLQATGGTSYLWTGPNGFYSTQPNPVINRINRNHAGIYAVIISNEGGCELTLFVKVDVVNPKGGDNLINVTTTKIAEGKIYPNPASNQITLQSNSDAPTVYSIIDMQGRIVVKNATTDNGQVNVEHLAPGIYNVMWSQPDVMGDAFKGRFVKVK